MGQVWCACARVCVRFGGRPLACTHTHTATAASPASPSSPIEPPPLDHPTPEALARMCSAVATLIEGVGEDSGREGLFDTPKVSRELLRERGRERDRLYFPVATDTLFLTGVPLSSIL